jgi:hypothetical protein
MSTRGEYNPDVARIILSYLETVTRASEEDISQEVERCYQVCREPMPWFDVFTTLCRLSKQRKLTAQAGKWEGEIIYKLRKIPAVDRTIPLLFPEH